MTGKSTLNHFCDGMPHGARASARQRWPWSRWSCLAWPLLAVLALGACATTTPGGRQQLAGPEPITALYSSLDLRLTLAAAAPVATACSGVRCTVDRGFERQVVRLGTRLAAEAYRIYPELGARVPGFRFVVAEMREGGSSSDASGTIVIYRGVREAPLDEEALAFLIASEMGRVIARHHDEKFTATVISSVIAQLVLAPVNLARGAAFLASSAATAFGRKLLVGDIRQKRMTETDTIAIALLGSQGWRTEDVAESLAGYSARLAASTWSVHVSAAVERLAGQGGSDVAYTGLRAAPDATLAVADRI